MFRVTTLPALCAPCAEPPPEMVSYCTGHMHGLGALVRALCGMQGTLRCCTPAGVVGPSPCMRHPPAPPRVLRDSGVGAMAPTAPKFLCACFPFHQTIHVSSARLARQCAIQMSFVLAKMRKRYYHIHTSVPPNPQTHIPPGGMHVVVVGCAEAPPPWEPPAAAEPAPHILQLTPPPPAPLPSFDR